MRISDWSSDVCSSDLLDVRGVAVHIGSQLTALAPLEAAFEKVGALIEALRDEGHNIRTADLGGGLGVPYDPALPIPPSPAPYGDMVKRVTAAWGVRLLYEPGRVLAGNAGALCQQVPRVKKGASQPFIIVHSAKTNLPPPPLSNTGHE